MKISSYHKNNNDVVFLNPDVAPEEFELSYASIIFPWTDDPNTTYIGGPKYSNSVLPERIDACFPDYSLYPELKYSIGITYRGCPRSCWFCFNHLYPKQHFQTSIMSFHNPAFDTVSLLDSNFLASPWWKLTCEEIKSSGASLALLNGIDARLLTKDSATTIASLKHTPACTTNVDAMTIAWDNPSDEKIILRGINHLLEAGISSIRCYVLISARTTTAEDMHRVETLLDYGITPIVIVHNPKDVNKRNVYEYIHKLYPEIPKSTIAMLPENRSEFIPLIQQPEKMLR